MAHNNSQRFQIEEKIFGKLGENIRESFENFGEACSNYGLTEELKMKYVHNFFDGEAKPFYSSYVQYTSDRYHLAAGKMVTEFNDISHRNRVRAYLQDLKLPEVLKKEN